jgi:hypothetical protein
MSTARTCKAGDPSCVPSGGGGSDAARGEDGRDASGAGKKDVIPGGNGGGGDGSGGIGGGGNAGGQGDARRDLPPASSDARDARDTTSDQGPGPGDGRLGDSPADARLDGGRDGLPDLPNDGPRDVKLDGPPGDRVPDTILCGTREICGNGIDDDCNGLVDCFDRACQSDPSCINKKKEVCDNGIDDDGNGLVDCKDPSCFGDKVCVVPGREICNNNLDDDDDDLADCADSDCAGDPTCVVRPGNEICDNGKDDNADGLADCTDPQCKTFPACLQAACTVDVDFGVIASSGASVTRTISTLGATNSYATCAPPGGVARVGSFSLAAAADLRLDISQTTGSAHVVALFRAGVGQACDQNPVDCVRVGDKATQTRTFNALPAGSYWIAVQSFPGTPGSATLTLSTGKASATETCDNGKDDDGDGAIDCADLDCASASNCNLCVADINLGAIVLGGSSKTATVDTTLGSNRYHPSCTGLSTGNDVVVRFSVKETVGITLSWTQTGDHMYGLFDVPTQGLRCDSDEGGCADMQGRQSGTTNWSYFEPGDYLLIFKARAPGQEGKIRISLTAFANRGIEICNNNIDDDGDLLVDCDDSDCFGMAPCNTPMCAPDGDLGSIDVGTTVSVHVDLTSATQVYQSDCSNDGHGRAYRLNVLAPLELEFYCTQTGDQVFLLSSQLGPLDLCDAHLLTCADPSTLPGGCNFGIPAVQPGSYYLLVQAFRRGTEGTVDLRLRGATQRVLEICDNGVDDDGDGAADCDDRKCATEEICTKRRCRPDKDLGLLVIDGSAVSLALQTSGAGNDQTKSTCASAPTGADGVVGFSLPGKTDLTIEWAQVGNHALVLYQADVAPLPCEANTLVECKATAGASTGSYVHKGLPAGQYFLVVDADRAGSDGGVILQLSGFPAQ